MTIIPETCRGTCLPESPYRKRPVGAEQRCTCVASDYGCALADHPPRSIGGAECVSCYCGAVSYRRQAA